MKPIRYSDAVPPMPEHFRSAMLETLGGLEPMKRRNKLTLSLAVVVAAMLALAGMAFAAAQYGILDFIFSGSAPGEDAAKAVRTVNAAVKGEYADFTVHDYVFDGRDLYVNWTLQMHTEERLVLVSTGMMADFPTDFYCDQGIPGSLAPCNPFTDAFPGGTWSSMNQGHFYEGEYDQPFDVTMELALVRPDPDAAMVSAMKECDLRDQPVWIYDDESVTWGYGYYRTEHEIGGDDDRITAKLDARAGEIGQHQAWLELFEEYGFGEVVEQLSVTFPVVPGSAPIMRLAGPQSFALADYTLTVDSVLFTGFSAHIDLTLILPEPPERFRPDFRVLADGQPLELAQQMDSSADPVCFTCDLWSEGGCSLLPSELTLITGSGEEISLPLQRN